MPRREIDELVDDILLGGTGDAENLKRDGTVGGERIGVLQESR